jgi:hypothetical protein
MSQRQSRLIVFTIGLAVVLFASAYAAQALDRRTYLPWLGGAEPVGTPVGDASVGCERCLGPQPPTEYHVTDVEITLERTMCFGPCPAYEVRVWGDGRVRYEGRENVQIAGVHEGRIDREAFDHLLDDFYDAAFFDLLPEYVHRRIVEIEDDGLVQELWEEVSDGSSAIITIRIGDYEKTVVDYLDSPPELRELSSKIDEAAGTARWVGP